MIALLIAIDNLSHTQKLTGGFAVYLLAPLGLGQRLGKVIKDIEAALLRFL